MESIGDLAGNGAVKVIVGALLSLLIAFAGYQLQLGGRRRRRRKEIRDELELVALLGDRPEAVRLRARADALLGRYTPDPLDPSNSSPKSTPPWWVELSAIAASVAVSEFVPLWAIIAGAVVVLSIVITIDFVLQGIRDNRAADAAERTAVGSGEVADNDAAREENVSHFRKPPSGAASGGDIGDPVTGSTGRGHD